MEKEKKYKCFICDSEVEYCNDYPISRSSQILVFANCQNCGVIGYYSNKRDSNFKNFLIPSEFKDKRLKFLACERNLREEDNYILCLDIPKDLDIEHWEAKYKFITYKDFISNYVHPKPHEVFDRVLQNLESYSNSPGDIIPISHPAFVYSENDNQKVYILKELEDMGYITGIISNGHSEVRISSEGWQRLSELSKTTTEGNQVFVAMWFDDSMENIYKNGIKKAIEADEIYKSLKINDKLHNNDITNEIIAEIKRSKFIVADFTGQRGGVYYEAGFARGLGKEVIYIVKEDKLKDLHFDTQQISHIIYKDAEDLYIKLLNQIRATIS